MRKRQKFVWEAMILVNGKWENHSYAATTEASFKETAISDLGIDRDTVQFRDVKNLTVLYKQRLEDNIMRTAYKREY